ncbi:g12211 [Coccomyxa viridis]|uniref:G12211 protein n=1 Tax=Coccomyxa viridis TaxID=1274662 RepID=A0ABP1GE32_9CHLO
MPATLEHRCAAKWDLTNSALHDALQVSMKEQLVRALGKTLSQTWNVNAYSISDCEPVDTTAQQKPTAAALPEGILTIEEDEELRAEEQTAQQQGPSEDIADSSMCFLSAGERKQLGKQAGGERRGRGSLGGPSPPPAEFFCPISHCLMMEPVKILNTGVTINRTSAQAWMRTRSQVCPVTGQPLRGWVAMESNDALRERIQQWVTEQGINISLLENAAVMMHDLCARVAR